MTEGGPDEAAASGAAPAFDQTAFLAELARHGLTRDDLSLMIRIGFAAAARGVTRDARAIADAVKALAPDHASWAIMEYLCLMAEGARAEALDLLERDGLACARAWEQAAELLAAELDPVTEHARRAAVVARLSAAHETGGDPHNADDAPELTEAAT